MSDAATSKLLPPHGVLIPSGATQPLVSNVLSSPLPPLSQGWDSYCAKPDATPLSGLAEWRRLVSGAREAQVDTGPSAAEAECPLQPLCASSPEASNEQTRRAKPNQRNFRQPLACSRESCSASTVRMQRTSSGLRWISCIRVCTTTKLSA